MNKVNTEAGADSKNSPGVVSENSREADARDGERMTHARTRTPEVEAPPARVFRENSRNLWRKFALLPDGIKDTNIVYTPEVS